MRWFLPVALLSVAPLVACAGDSGPSSGEAAVCSTVQDMVDRLAARDSVAALETLPRLEDTTRESGNAVFMTAGSQFFDELVTDVDYRQLTIIETARYGQQYMESMSRYLGSIIDECRKVGAPVERLPDQRTYTWENFRG